jgi:hypothetical protein
MNWNMKKISTYRRSACVVMAVVMSVHVFGGLGLFCASETLRMFRALGIGTVALGIISSDDPGEVTGSAWDTAGSQGGNSNCCCKKHKKCAAIPRAAITSNPTHRFYEVQRQSKSVCCESFFPKVTDHRFATGGGPPSMKLVSRAPFYSSSPLELTSILLI